MSKAIGFSFVPAKEQTAALTNLYWMQCRHANLSAPLQVRIALTCAILDHPRNHTHKTEQVAKKIQILSDGTMINMTDGTYWAPSFRIKRVE